MLPPKVSQPKSGHSQEIVLGEVRVGSSIYGFSNPKDEPAELVLKDHSGKDGYFDGEDGFYLRFKNGEETRVDKKLPRPVMPPSLTGFLNGTGNLAASMEYLESLNRNSAYTRFLGKFGITKINQGTHIKSLQEYMETMTTIVAKAKSGDIKQVAASLDQAQGLRKKVSIETKELSVAGHSLFEAMAVVVLKDRDLKKLASLIRMAKEKPEALHIETSDALEEIKRDAWAFLVAGNFNSLFGDLSKLPQDLELYKQVVGLLGFPEKQIQEDLQKIFAELKGDAWHLAKEGRMPSEDLFKKLQVLANLMDLNFGDEAQEIRAYVPEGERQRLTKENKDLADLIVLEVLTIHHEAHDRDYYPGGEKDAHHILEIQRAPNEELRKGMFGIGEYVGDRVYNVRYAIQRIRHNAKKLGQDPEVQFQAVRMQIATIEPLAVLELSEQLYSEHLEEITFEDPKNSSEKDLGKWAPFETGKLATSINRSFWASYLYFRPIRFLDVLQGLDLKKTPGSPKSDADIGAPYVPDTRHKVF